MTLQIKDIDTDGLQFPDTGAKRVKPGDANGHVINYIDARGNADSIFIRKRFWDDAKAEFEEDVFHSVIIDHYPALEVYEP